VSEEEEEEEEGGEGEGEKLMGVDYVRFFDIHWVIIMMMMVVLIVYMMLNKKTPSITDRIIIDVIHYYNIFTNDFCTILSIDDSATTATTTTTTTTATNANVVSIGTRRI
jgi:hypothetical protein